MSKVSHNKKFLPHRYSEKQVERYCENLIRYNKNETLCKIPKLSFVKNVLTPK